MSESNQGETFFGRILKFVGLNAVVGVLGLTLLAPLMVVSGVGGSLGVALFDSLPGNLEPVNGAQASTLYGNDDEGNPVKITDFYEDNRISVAFEDISDNFKNAVIVMTSNIGSHMIQAMVGKPYEDVKDAVWDELKNHFRPEFLNRIDETVVFHGLDAQHIASIAKIQLQALRERLARMDLELDVSEPALSELAKVGFDPVFGARPLKRAIQQRLENPLSRQLLEGRFLPKSRIVVSVDPVRQPGVFEFTAQAPQD